MSRKDKEMKNIVLLLTTLSYMPTVVTVNMEVVRAAGGGYDYSQLGQLEAKHHVAVHPNTRVNYCRFIGGDMAGRYFPGIYQNVHIAFQEDALPHLDRFQLSSMTGDFSANCIVMNRINVEVLPN